MMENLKHKGPLIDPALCRCCRSIKKCRLLTTEYEWMGQKEVYSEILIDVFGLLVSFCGLNRVTTRLIIFILLRITSYIIN